MRWSYSTSRWKSLLRWFSCAALISTCCFWIQVSMVLDSAKRAEELQTACAVRMREELLSPVVVFSTVFIIRWTIGSWSYDQELCARVIRKFLIRWPRSSWLARSTIAFSSLEYAVASDRSTPDNWSSCSTSSLWKAGPRSVCITSGVPNRPKCWKTHVAVSNAVVVLVGNNSTHREKASIKTRIYSYPWSSCDLWIRGRCLDKRTMNGWLEVS